MPNDKTPWPERNDKHWFSVEICHKTFRKQSGYLSMKGRQALQSLNEKRELHNQLHHAQRLNVMGKSGLK
jgi:hypothetical protein